MSTPALMMEQRIANLPPHIRNQPCTDKDQVCREILLKVSQTTIATSHSLGRWLGVQECDLTAIEQDFRAYPVADRKYEVLLKWINSLGSMATFEKLCTAIYSAGDVPTTQSVLDRLCPQQSTGGASSSIFANCQKLHRASTSSTHNYRQPEEEVGSCPPTFTDSPANGRYGNNYSNIDPLLGNTFNGTHHPLDNNGLPNHTVMDPTEETTSADQKTSRPHHLSIPPNTPYQPTPPIDSGISATSSVTPSPFDSITMKCSHPISKWLHDKMRNKIMEYEARLSVTMQENFRLRDKVDEVSYINQMQREEITRKGKQGLMLMQEAQYYQEINYRLSGEIEIQKELLSLLCTALEDWKEQINEEYSLDTLQKRIDDLLSTVTVTNTHGVLTKLNSELQQLKSEKADLKEMLQSFQGAYADKAKQLELLQKENEVLQGGHKEVEQLQVQLAQLLGEKRQWLAEKKQLEDKVSELEKDKACLQQECAELKEKAVIIEVVPSKTLDADSKMGYARSYSDNSYSRTQTSRKPSLEKVHAQSVDSGANWDQSKQKIMYVTLDDASAAKCSLHSGWMMDASKTLHNCVQKEKLLTEKFTEWKQNMRIVMLEARQPSPCTVK